MSAHTRGSRASRLSESSSAASQYLVRGAPASYAALNAEPTCIARIAVESCVIGCICLGSERMSDSTPGGSADRRRSSVVSDDASCCVGTSPVSSSHSVPSGSGSPPGTRDGRRAQTSGSVKPR